MHLHAHKDDNDDSCTSAIDRVKHVHSTVKLIYLGGVELDRVAGYLRDNVLSGLNTP